MKSKLLIISFVLTIFLGLLFTVLLGPKKSEYLIKKIESVDVFSEKSIENDINYLISKEAVLRFSDNGDFYVLDKYRSTIKRFNKRLLYKESIGRAGQGPGEFIRPVDLYVDKQCKLYVADLVTSTISIFDSSGIYKTIINLKNSYRDIRLAVDSKGLIYVNNPVRNKLISVYDEMGNELSSFGKMNFHKRKDAMTDLNHASLLFDSEEHLWVIFMNTPKIQEYSKDGLLLFEKTINSPRNDFLIKDDLPIPENGGYSLTFYFTDAVLINPETMIIANHDYLIEYDIKKKTATNYYLLDIPKERKDNWIFTANRIAYNINDNCLYYGHLFLDNLNKTCFQEKN